MSRIEELLKVEDRQRAVLLKTARRVIPALTDDDLLQPFDYPLIEQDPLFRYEEGVLHGIQMAIACLRREERNSQ